MADQTARIKQGQKFTVEGIPTCPKTLAGLGRDVADVLLSGYATVVWPRWTRDFELVAVEKEMPKALAPWLTYNSRPDTIMRRKSDKTLWYGPEDKTTAWLDSLLGYQKNIQLHATALCIEENLGETVAGALVQGLYKGFVKEEKLYHPLMFAYYKEGQPGIMPDQWSQKWVRGWERASTKDFKDGFQGWMKKLGEDFLLQEVFPMSPPITLNRPLAAQYLKQVLLREEEIKAFHEKGGTDLDAFFPQSFNQCDGFGKGRRECGFKPLCYNPTTAKFPLQLYKWREPHHANEKEQSNVTDR